VRVNVKKAAVESSGQGEPEMPTKVSHETRPPMTPFAADLFDEMQILTRRVQRYAARARQV
jgi:hypothetical protein